MTLRLSRRRAMQTTLSAAAVATLPRGRAVARQSTPIVVNEAMITSDQVEAALPKLDGLLENATPGEADVNDREIIESDSSWRPA